MRVRWLGALGALIAIVLLTAMGTVSAAAGGKGNRDKLSKHDRALLTEQRIGGESTTTLLVATNEGSAATVAASLSALGGKIVYRDDLLGYIRVSLPLDKAVAASKVDGITAVDVDELLPLPSPRPDAGDTTPAVDPPGPTTPGQNAYMPTRDIGAPQFIAANPTYDGRGVTIGILDTGIDLFTPELQTAKDKNGKSTRKIVDWVTYTDPLDDDDPTWVVTGTAVTSDGAGSFTVGATTYTAPKALESFALGTLNEADPRLGGELGNNLNRDGDSTDVYGVLRQGKDVWVDSDTDLSFADEPKMRDYKQKYDVSKFGTDIPATPVRETVPFVVQVDEGANAVNIGIVSGAHGTHVAGIAAGKDFFGGAYDGAAPEAQIVSVRVCLFITGCTSHALIEGMIFAAKTAKVDVINMSIGGLPALNDGNNARAVLYDRLIDKEKVQMFISAGNSGPGINTIGDPSVATKVMSVGAYVHKDTWLSNYNAIATKNDGMFVFSSRGPREDGGFKPNISAPGSAVSTIPAWQNPAGQCLAYACPPGYAMFNGTSMASPQAAGGAALLISAAKQTGKQWLPDQLRQAINSSGRYLPFYGAHEQGNGLFQVGAAWNLLKTNIQTVEIASSAPVNTIISDFLATPDSGPGIYEREGWEPGESGSRSIALTRLSGGNATYNLTLVGNDGTFALTGSASVELKHNGPVSVPVAIGPVTAGVHSTILNVDDPATVGIDYQVMNTVVAAEQFTLANNYSVTRSGSADRPDRANPTFFYYVPAGTPAFKVDVTTNTGRIRTLRQHPYGVPFDGATAYCSAGAACQVGQPAGTISRTTTNPQSGVWEVTLDTSRTSTTDPATFTITATILGATVSPNPDVIASATIGVPIARSYTLTNLFGPFTGRAVGTGLGSARRGVFSIANLEQQQYQTVVTAGSTSLRATIGGTSDLSADLDLFVFNCTTGTCVLAGQSADGDSEESVTIANPAAGTWVILVDGFSVPAGTTTYNYVDVFANPAFGSVSVTDANALRPSGSVWTVPGSVTANSAPAAGRVLLGNVQVRTDTNVLVGSGDVIVNSVTP